MIKTKHFISKSIIAIIVILALWLVFSVADISIHNLSQNPIYSNYNAFTMLLK